MNKIGINLTEMMFNTYTVNYKTLLKKVKEDLNKWRNVFCLWLGRLNIVR